MVKQPTPIDKNSIVSSGCTLFLELFERHHSLNWEPEPDYLPDFRLAINTLRRRTGLTISELAIRTCQPTTNMQQIENKGGPVRKEMAEALAGIAREYRLMKLALWFESEYRIQEFNKRQTKDSRREDHG